MVKNNVQPHQQVTLNMKALRHGLTRWPTKNTAKGSQAEASATS